MVGKPEHTTMICLIYFFILFYFIIIFYNGETLQDRALRTHPYKINLGPVYRTLGSFHTQDWVNCWLFTKGCNPKGLFAPKRCWTLNLEGSKPPRQLLGPTPWGYDLFDNYARFPNTKVVATIQNSATQTGKRKYSL